jgi:hypothetical protein
LMPSAILRLKPVTSVRSTRREKSPVAAASTSCCSSVCMAT